MENLRSVRDAQKVMATLGRMPEPVSHSVLVVVSGLPGTGKSYFSRVLSQQCPFVIVETDAVRKTLVTSPVYSPDEHYRVFLASHLVTEELLKRGVRVIFDATNLMESQRKRLYHIAEKLGAKLLIVRVEAPEELVRQRLEARSQGADSHDHSDADWTIYEIMKPTQERIRRNHYVVDTSKDISLVVEKILIELRRP